MTATRTPYRGLTRSIVIAFDIGTTFSGISYSILDPGRVPTIMGVMRFPGQAESSSSSKIPTALYYDKAGTLRAVGAEAMAEGLYELASEEEWVLVEWFKLHMRPQKDLRDDVADNIPKLPRGKSVITILADFLRYLFKCARAYIEGAETTNSGTLWSSCGDRIHFVLTHPNGWEGIQQQYMRKAAVLADLITDDMAGQSCISFVTEGEASLHFAIRNGISLEAVTDKQGVLIVDAGGGTIDMSAYRQVTDPRGNKSFEEISAPQCHFNGAVFVSIQARIFLKKHLAESPYLADIEHIVQCFDKTTKVHFRDSKVVQFIRFGSNRDNDPKHNIRFGQLKLAGDVVADFFKPSLKCIVDAVIEQRENSLWTFSNVILVGGFSMNDWLRDQVASSLEPLDIKVQRPENYVNKAVTDGAISFYLDHYVQKRISKATFGTSADRAFDFNDPEHIKRMHKTYISLDGIKSVEGAFSVILPKNTQVSETAEFRRTLTFLCKTRMGFSSVTSSIWYYSGDTRNPEWMDFEKEMFSELCKVEMDLSHLAKNMQDIKQSTGPKGTFYKMHFDLVLLFGTTEFKAQMAWKEDGVEKRSPAKVIYFMESPSIREG